tara:strand:+ start:457 stop:777 length:321 start_codon:yes stop_codon:yes gene_type:complete
MNKLVIFLIIFFIVSVIALTGMKYILLVMFRWGGLEAILLTLFFLLIYAGVFLGITRKWKDYRNYISISSLKWIWILGIAELGLFGFLYHKAPNFFPSFLAEFFFS